MSLSFLWALLGGYLLGAIPFGLLIAKAMGQGDIRNIGSGNIGATNVLRTGRKDLAFITLLLDGGKAATAALLAGYFLGVPENMIAAVGALFGHCFPVWLGFKGGKGVATFFGGLLAVMWPLGLIAGATWLLMAFLFRYSSLAALVAAVSAPLIAGLLGKPQVAMMAGVYALIILIRHRENIGRLRSGTESKIGGNK